MCEGRIDVRCCFLSLEGRSQDVPPGTTFPLRDVALAQIRFWLATNCSKALSMSDVIEEQSNKDAEHLPWKRGEHPSLAASEWRACQQHEWSSLRRPLPPFL